MTSSVLVRNILVRLAASMTLIALTTHKVLALGWVYNQPDYSADIGVQLGLNEEESDVNSSVAFKRSFSLFVGSWYPCFERSEKLGDFSENRNASVHEVHAQRKRRKTKFAASYSRDLSSFSFAQFNIN